MSEITVIGKALKEFLAREELVLHNSPSSLLITDYPIPLLAEWNGIVLTSHKAVQHKRVVTELSPDFKTSETLICLSPLSEIARWQVDLALAVTTGTVSAVAENRRGAERLAKLIGKQEHPEMVVVAREHCRAISTPHTATSTYPILAPHLVSGWEDIHALPGVFSADRADRGTQMLRGCALEKITTNQKVQSVLDLGCGCGVIGISLLERSSNLSVDFVDVDFRAIESTRVNLGKRSLSSERVFWLDATTENCPQDKYDLVLLNPPFHAHGTEHRELGRKMIERGLQLTSGELLVVGNTHLGYDRFLSESTSDVHKLLVDNQFTVWSARPIKSGKREKL